MNEFLEKAKMLLLSRKQAYEQTFNDGPNAKLVLKDLADFCRADKSTFHENERIHAVLEGRREVWLRVQKYLQLTPEELWDLHRRE